MVWALPKREFQMSWLHWVLLLMILSLLSYEVYMELWKLSNSVWYCNFDFGDGHPWRPAYEIVNVLSKLACGCYNNTISLQRNPICSKENYDDKLTA